MLLYVTGSYPDNQEGIAAAAKVLLDAMIEVAGREELLLLTTKKQIISKNIETNANCEYLFMDNWRVTSQNIKRIYSILDKYPITAVHMEYPGDLYGKTFLASFLPFLIHRYNKKTKKNITVNVRLHEFTNARFLRKIAILPILLCADRIYVPAQRDRETVSKIAPKRVFQTKIGTNIMVVDNKLSKSDKIVISYFGSVYHGKGIERMLLVWKQIKEQDTEEKYQFKIIGDIGTEEGNHFAEFHRQVWNWIEQYGLKDCIEVTGYVSDEEASELIQQTQIATLLYEDGLTLRRGSFLAYLAHGIPIVTSMGDSESVNLFGGHKGVSMTRDNSEVIHAIEDYSRLTWQEREEIRNDNVELSKNFDWNEIASELIKDYGIGK